MSVIHFMQAFPLTPYNKKSIFIHKMSAINKRCEMGGPEKGRFSVSSMGSLVLVYSAVSSITVLVSPSMTASTVHIAEPTGTRCTKMPNWVAMFLRVACLSLSSGPIGNILTVLLCSPDITSVVL